MTKNVLGSPSAHYIEEIVAYTRTQQSFVTTRRGLKNCCVTMILFAKVVLLIVLCKFFFTFLREFIKQYVSLH